MRLVTWNVNGLRACLGKGFLDFFQRVDADVVCLQETKLQPDQIALELPGYRLFWNSAEKKGYSGTAVFTRVEPLSVTCGIGLDAHDHEGRVITAEFDGFFLVCCYTPEFPGRLKAPRLPDAVGGRLPGLPHGAGQKEAGGAVRRSQRGP